MAKGYEIKPKIALIAVYFAGRPIQKCMVLGFPAFARVLAGISTFSNTVKALIEPPSYRTRF